MAAPGNETARTIRFEEQALRHPPKSDLKLDLSNVSKDDLELEVIEPQRTRNRNHQRRLLLSPRARELLTRLKPGRGSPRRNPPKHSMSADLPNIYDESTDSCSSPASTSPRSPSTTPRTPRTPTTKRKQRRRSLTSPRIFRKSKSTESTGNAMPKLNLTSVQDRKSPDNTPLAPRKKPVFEENYFRKKVKRKERKARSQSSIDKTNTTPSPTSPDSSRIIKITLHTQDPTQKEQYESFIVNTEVKFRGGSENSILMATRLNKDLYDFYYCKVIPIKKQKGETIDFEKHQELQALKLTNSLIGYAIEHDSKVVTLYIILPNYGKKLLDIIKPNTKLNKRHLIATAFVENICKLHNLNIIHLDLTPSNVCYRGAPFQLNIIDFGECVVLPKEYAEDESIITSPRGAPFFIAPEIFKQSDKFLKMRNMHNFSGTQQIIVTKKCDVYTAGITLMFIYGMDDKENPEWSEDKKLVHIYEDVIEPCLTKKPKNRVTSEELYELITKIDIEAKPVHTPPPPVPPKPLIYQKRTSLKKIKQETVTNLAAIFEEKEKSHRPKNK